MVEIRPPTTKPNTKMNMAAEIHGATKACVGTRIRRDSSRRIIVHSPTQLIAMGGMVATSAVFSTEFMRHLLYGPAPRQSRRDRSLRGPRLSKTQPSDLHVRFFRH